MADNDFTFPGTTPYNENFPFNESQMGEFSGAKNPFSMTDLASLLSQKAAAPKPNAAAIDELLHGAATQATLATGTPQKPTAEVIDPVTGLSPNTARAIAYSDEIQPRWQVEKAMGVLNKEAAEAVAPLQNFYTYGTENAPAKPGSIEDLKQWSNLNTGRSFEALQELGKAYPGTGATAPVFTPDAPAKGVGIGKAVQPSQPAGQVDKTGLTQTIGSEFGEVDNPARGGYTEANWNVGAWGDTISGKDTKLIALPVNNLKAYGNPNSSNFAKEFNSKYDVQIVDPKTGKAVVSALGDKGPGASTGAGIDLTYGTRAALGLAEGFKGPVQYRVVPKGSSLPDGSTSTASTQPAPGAAPVPDLNMYFHRLDPTTLKDPEIYGVKNTDKDNMMWARNQTDEYATTMANAGNPITTQKYEEIFHEFYQGTVKKAQGEVAQALPAADSDRANSLITSLPMLDQLMESKKKAGQFIPIKPAPGVDILGMTGDVSKYVLNAAGERIMPQKPEESDYYAKRGLVSPVVAAGLTGQKGASLSDNDRISIERSLPLENDTLDESQTKINTLKQNTLDQLKVLIQTRRAGHFDTRDLEAQYMGLRKQLQPVVNQQAAAEIHNRGADSIAGKAKGQQPQSQSAWWLPPQSGAGGN